VRRLAVVVAALAALLVAAPADARVPHGWLGVQVDGPLTEPGNPFAGEWDLMASSGVETVRVAFDWAAAQPAAGGPIDLTTTDAVVIAAAQRRMPVLPVVHRAPGWAAARPSDGPASSPSGTAAFAQYLTALVQRYGPTGSLWAERPGLPRLPIREWQIWNEPNLTLYWTPQPFAKRYVALLKASRRALRAQDPGAKIVLAGLPNISWVALREIYRAGGRGAFDAVALHPYTRTPGNILRLVRLARKETRRFHDGRVPIWLTEISWASSRGKVNGLPGLVTDERGQAARLRAALPRLARARKKLRIQKVIWYTWISREGSRNPFDWSGLRRLRGDRVVSVPALAVFRRAARRLAR
jgi:hypothetical protein